MPISTTYTIKNTQGNLSFTINVGSASGPLELVQTADLTFYGYGRTGWGQEVDQNFYRLLENFAVPELTSSPPKPKTKDNLSGVLGTGINRPVLGQLWFNTTVNSSVNAEYPNTGGELYVCTQATTDSSIAPGPASIAASKWKQLISVDYANYTYLSKNDASGTGPYAFVKLNGYNSPMTGFLELIHTNPSATWHAAPKGYVDDEILALRTEADGKYVERAGDTMSGQLSVEGPGSGSYVKIDVQTGANEPRVHLGKYTGTTDADIGFFTSGGGLLHMDSGILATGGNSGVTNQGTLTLIGFAMVDRAPTLSNQISNKGYVDTGLANLNATLTSQSNGLYVKKAGDTMTGSLNMSSHTITNLPTPTASSHPATKNYVDTNCYAPAGTPGFTYNITISAAAPSGGNIGDIWFQL